MPAITRSPRVLVKLPAAPEKAAFRFGKPLSMYNSSGFTKAFGRGPPLWAQRLNPSGTS
jgi:hypothetical protein